MKNYISVILIAVLSTILCVALFTIGLLVYLERTAPIPVTTETPVLARITPTPQPSPTPETTPPPIVVAQATDSFSLDEIIASQGALLVPYYLKDAVAEPSAAP